MSHAPSFFAAWLTAERSGHSRRLRLLPPYGAAKAAPLQDWPLASATLRWTWWTLVPLALVAAAVAAPYCLTHGLLAMGLALERGFAIICHQRPERSFWISGAEMAVCSRCLGIYLGAAVGLLFRTSRRIALRLLIAAVALNFFDALTELAGLHGNWLVIRFAFGLLLGSAATLLISSSVAATATSPVD
jgi:uncharacterized membrane protein